MSGIPTPYDGTPGIRKIDPADVGSMTKEKANSEMERRLKRLYELAYLMYADNKRSLLVILQGIDGSGKDGTVRHIASGLNPQGFTVRSFKVPSDGERDHDYLWRIHAAAPARGEVAIFNRSHYEEVILPLVHPEMLENEQLPDEILRKKALVDQRYRQINDFERILAENGTLIVKFFLLISKDEQMRRFQQRLDDPTRQWKFSVSDLAERNFWDTYMKAYQRMLDATSTEHAPWYVIPADKKWYRNHLISSIIVDRLENVSMTFPPLTLKTS